MLISESVTDTLIVYMILKRLMKPFNEWDAFTLGIIDENGDKLKSPGTLEERSAWTMLDRFVHKIKRIMEKFVGKSKLAAMMTTAYILKESYQKLLGDSGSPTFLNEEKSIKSWTHTNNEEFYKIVKKLDMLPTDPEHYMVESNSIKFELDLYKYFKLVENKLSEEDFEAINRLVRT